MVVSASIHTHGTVLRGNRIQTCLRRIRIPFCSLTPPGMDTMHFVSYEIEGIQQHEANSEKFRLYESENPDLGPNTELPSSSATAKLY
jgi:hypothetical protein